MHQTTRPVTSHTESEAETKPLHFCTALREHTRHTTAKRTANVLLDAVAQVSACVRACVQLQHNARPHTPTPRVPVRVHSHLGCRGLPHIQKSVEHGPSPACSIGQASVPNHPTTTRWSALRAGLDSEATSCLASCSSRGRRNLPVYARSI